MDVLFWTTGIQKTAGAHKEQPFYFRPRGIQIESHGKVKKLIFMSTTIGVDIITYLYSLTTAYQGDIRHQRILHGSSLAI